MHARGEIGVDDSFLHESITGTTFTSRIKQLADVGPYRGIVPEGGGQAWITGLHSHVLMADEPIPTGYRLTDTWPAGGSARLSGKTWDDRTWDDGTNPAPPAAPAAE